jgi:hypothetical protein
MMTCVAALEDGLKGMEFLEGIKHIIGADNQVPSDQIDYKPFVGSFTNLNPTDNLDNVSYCMTDDACGQPNVYDRKDVPLSVLGCNNFCYIATTNPATYSISHIYTTQNPPDKYLNCGWETCG